MTTIHRVPIGFKIITKGAPDVLLERCTKDFNNGEIKEMTASRLKQIRNLNENMAKDALRVLAIAYIDVPNMPQKINPEMIERNLIFVRFNWHD